MTVYCAWYGCGQGTNSHFKLITNLSDDEIMLRLWEMACEEAESYSGLHGIMDIHEEDYDSEEEFTEAWLEEREQVIDYGFVPWDESRHAELRKRSGNRYLGLRIIAEMQH